MCNICSYTLRSWSGNEITRWSGEAWLTYYISGLGRGGGGGGSPFILDSYISIDHTGPPPPTLQPFVLSLIGPTAAVLGPYALIHE